jgi:hypothetical protein
VSHVDASEIRHDVPPRASPKRSGKKHSVVAWEAGINPATLSRILNAGHGSPALETVVRIIHAVDESVGALLCDEQGFALTTAETKQIQQSIQILHDVLAQTHASAPWQPPAAPASSADIVTNDAMFVKSTHDVRSADGRVVVIRIDATTQVRYLSLRNGHIRLLSRHDDFPSFELPVHDMRARAFALIGIVVDRGSTS